MPTTIRDSLFLLDPPEEKPLGFFTAPVMGQALTATLFMVPSLLTYFFWCLITLNAWLEPSLEIYALPQFYLPVVAGLLLLLLVVVRLSPKARQTNKFGLWVLVFSAGMLIIFLVPKGWSFFVLLILFFAGMAYWLSPFKKLREQIRPEPVAQQRAMMVVIFQLMEKVVNRHYRDMPTALYSQLEELHEIFEQPNTLAEQPEYRVRFCALFSRHFSPLLAAVSCRANGFAHDNPHLQWFMAAYPPFPASERSMFNLVSFFTNSVSQNEAADPRVKILWLKSGLLVASKQPDTLPETLFELYLRLLPLLLAEVNKHRDEIVQLFQEQMQLADGETMNGFQCNSWVSILQTLVRCSENQPELVPLFVDLHNRYPGHQNSFGEGVFSYSAERKRALDEVVAALVDQSERADTINPFSVILDEVLQLSHQALMEFLQTTSDQAVAIMLNHVPIAQQEAFHQKHLDMTAIDAREHFQALIKPGDYWSSEEQQAIVRYLSRMLNAGKRMVGLLDTMLEETAETNFTNDPNCYETDLETKLNQAVMSRVDKVDVELKPILQEFRSDVEGQGIQLGAFLPHLGRKFGGLIGVIHQCFPHDLYAWFLEVTDAKEPAALPGARNYFFRIMQQKIDFHSAMLSRDLDRSFATLHGLVNLLIPCYPLYREACEAGLVTCLEIIANRTLPESLLDSYFDTFEQLPELSFSQLSYEREENLKKLIQNAVQHFNLLSNPQLGDRHRAILQAYTEPE